MKVITHDDAITSSFLRLLNGFDVLDNGNPEISRVGALDHGQC